MALAHTIYSFVRKESSEAYKSFEEMMVLSHSSQPAPESLANISAGIRSRRTLQTPVRSRVATGANLIQCSEEIQLAFGSPSKADFNNVEVDKAYGIAD